MKETLEQINRFYTQARILDAQLIKGRTATAQKNLSEIEGINRSPKYVERLAGKSSDLYRKSRTQQMVQWLGSTTFENLPQMLLVKAFYQQIFEYAENHQSFYVVRDFWTIDEQNACLEAARRMAVQAQDIIRATQLSMQIGRNEQEISMFLSSMPVRTTAGVIL